MDGAGQHWYVAHVCGQLLCPRDLHFVGRAFKGLDGHRHATPEEIKALKRAKALPKKAARKVLLACPKTMQEALKRRGVNREVYLHLHGDFVAEKVST